MIDQYWNGSATTDRFQYGYDRDSNALYKNNLENSGLSELYHPNSSASGDNASAYDNLNRLGGFVRGTLSASGNNGTGLDTVAAASSVSRHNETWSLDTLGNWSSQSVDGTATGRTHNGKNELTAVGASSLSFDSAGNTTADNTGQSYVYDGWNRLVKAADSTGYHGASYSYDGLGRRMIRLDLYSNHTIQLYYSDNWQVLEERQPQLPGSVATQYVWGLGYDELVERDRDTNGDGTFEERLYAQQDANWNTTALLESTGAVQERFAYDPYGNVAVLTPSGAVTTDGYDWIYLHQGGRLDAATGSYNFRNRDYSPLLGRWIERDPAGYVDGMNLYGCDLSNPERWADATGLDAALARTVLKDTLKVDAGEEVIGGGPEDPIADGVAGITTAGGLIIAGVALFIPGDTPQKPTPTPLAIPVAVPKVDVNAQARQQEYEDYKKRCNEAPPPGLDPCALARWKLARNQDCMNMRQAWDDKWLPGRHAADIANLKRSISNLQDWITKNCCDKKK